MQRDIKARVLLSACLRFYCDFINLNIRNLDKTDFAMQKGNSANPTLIDIHATSQNVQLQYTRYSSCKPIPNKYSRN